MWPPLSPRASRNLHRIAPFGVIWLLFAQVFLISDYAAAGGFANVPDSAIVLDPTIYAFAIAAVTVVGCIVGAIELFVLNDLFATRSLRTKLLGKTAFYGVLLAVVAIVTFPIAAALEMGTSLGDPRVLQRLGAFLTSSTAAATGIQLSVSLIASLFYSEISEHMGPQTLRNFLSGRYHTPKVERRVFLFADMKSSTSIAEALGHQAYFELLVAYYRALADAIVDHGGEVYQYIGDEIVVSWPEAIGLRDGNCVRCAVQMKADLMAGADRFVERFGVAPDFRAGLQLGEVTTGEIGALKKEIAFSGDLLNQTARLLSLGAESDTDLLIGDELRAHLTGLPGWSFQSLGRHVLRGREQPVEVFTVHLESTPNVG